MVIRPAVGIPEARRAGSRACVFPPPDAPTSATTSPFPISSVEVRRAPARVAVREGDPLEPELAARTGRAGRGPASGDVARRVEDLEDPLAGGGALQSRSGRRGRAASRACRGAAPRRRTRRTSPRRARPARMRPPTHQIAAREPGRAHDLHERRRERADEDTPGGGCAPACGSPRGTARTPTPPSRTPARRASRSTASCTISASSPEAATAASAGDALQPLREADDRQERQPGSRRRR